MKRMNSMRRIKNRGISFLCIMFLMLTLNVTYAFADTDGTELQVIKAETLEVQLGEEWAGVQFQLMTDAGIYPEKIVVSDDGILSLELGGSSKYTLSCLNSSVAVPDQDETSEEEMGKARNVEKAAEKKQNDGKSNVKTVAGIPIAHIMLFSGGMIIAIAGLLIMKFVSRYRSEDQDEYDED